MPKHEFRVINTYPCPKLVAPYISIVLTQSKATALSIYRGDDARALLNKYGHHSQAQLSNASASERAQWGILGTPNRPGTSTHELKSDGRAFPRYPSGSDLPWWCEGLDVNGAAQAVACLEAAHRFGWEMFRPYSTGVELHHLCFKVEPKPRTVAMRARIVRLRTAPARLGGLPRS